jgi:hypothetical protein
MIFSQSKNGKRNNLVLAQASSIKSIALSGWNRVVMYRLARLAAATTAPSVILFEQSVKQKKP